MHEEGRAILLDANLLVLAVVGRFDRRLIGRKCLDEYAIEHFDLLAQTVAPYSRNLTTPHLLAEVSNLADQCVPKRRHREFRQFLDIVVVPLLDERWTPAVELCQTSEFRRIGLADAAICQLADERTFVLSVDAELCSVLWGRGINVENFSHLRDE
jgi:hypothetical protein